MWAILLYKNLYYTIGDIIKKFWIFVIYRFGVKQRLWRYCMQGFSFDPIWPIIQPSLQFTILRSRLDACGLPFAAIPPVTVVSPPNRLPTENAGTSDWNIYGTMQSNNLSQRYVLCQCFSTAGPRPGAGPWHQLYRAARDSPGIDN